MGTRIGRGAKTEIPGDEGGRGGGVGDVTEPCCVGEGDEAIRASWGDGQLKAWIGLGEGLDVVAMM